jgi:hypothetical protein
LLIVVLKMSSLPTLALKSPNKKFIWYLRNLSNTHLGPHRSCPSYRPFYSLLGNKYSEQW